MVEIDRSNWMLTLLFYGITAVLAIIGIVCNALLILVTIRTKTLRATVNILISVCAVADILHEVGILAQFPFLWDTNLEIDSALCYRIMFLPGIGIALGCVCILSVGVDRLLSFHFSLYYRMFNKVYYHVAIAFLIITYSASIPIIMVTYFQESRGTCGLLTPYPGMGLVRLSTFTLSINVLSALLYLLMWATLRVKAEAVQMKRIVKSLFIIVTVDVTGWLISPGLYHIFEVLRFNAQQMHAWEHFTRIFISFAMTFKLLIYYGTSSEYRAAINGILWKTNKSNIVAVTTVMSTMTTHNSQSSSLQK